MFDVRPFRALTVAMLLLGCRGGARELPLDPSVPPAGPLADQNAFSLSRSPWDNFATTDSIVEQHQITAAPPTMMLVAPWARYQEAPVEAILTAGKVDFWTVAELYRKGLISRDRRPEIVEQMRAVLAEHPAEDSYRVNALVGLIHIGFDEDAFVFIEAGKSERWFQESWDSNFYAGSLFFRYRDYARAVPFLERAMALHPDDFSKLWLWAALEGLGDEASKARAASVFQWAERFRPDPTAAPPLVDRADRLGLRRWQLAGAVAFVDVDGDDFLDFVGNGAYSHPEYFRFRPGHGFELQKDAVLADIHNVPPATLAADFDNDGLRDLYFTAAAWFSAGPNRLLRNAGGRFEDKSLDGDQALAAIHSCGAAALDFDHDGLLDLAVTGTKGGTLRLLRNLGGFRFEDVSERVGIQPDMATAVGLAVGDLDGNGWPDIFVNAFTPPHGGLPGTGAAGPDRLYMNRGGTFTDEALERGVALGTPMGFAAWTFDYDVDGDLDLFASNFTRSEADVLAGFQADRPNEGGFVVSSLYRNDGTGKFEDVGLASGLLPASIMGATWVDWDLDGDPDLVQGPGSHPLPTMQPLQFYENRDGRFVFGTPLEDPTLYGKFHGMAFADVDRDGDPDLYVNNGGVQLSDRFRDLFFENTTTKRGWIHLHLVGTKSNRDAIGARVRVRVGERWLTQEVAAGQGFSSTMSPYLIFGLGSAVETGPIEIRWPSGLVQELGPLKAGQSLRIREGETALKRLY